jgi:hypothetical protein
MRTGWHPEADGWSTLLVPDHLGGVSTFAPLVGATDATSTLRVGSLVISNDLFYPLQLAQEVSFRYELDSTSHTGLPRAKQPFEAHRPAERAGQRRL